MMLCVNIMLQFNHFYKKIDLHIFLKKIIFIVFIVCISIAATGQKVRGFDQVSEDTTEVTSPSIPPSITGKPLSFNQKLGVLIQSDPILKTGFSGLILYDLNTDTLIYSYNQDKYFVAASNTKLFTLYTCLHAFRDSIPALRYVENDSSFIFWGTADPTLDHPYFQDSTIIKKLKEKARIKRMVHALNDRLLPYGTGWMWDDYNESYQPEITALPVHGNVLTVDKSMGSLTIKPQLLMSDTGRDATLSVVQRKKDSNHFDFPTGLSEWMRFYQEVPYQNAAWINHRQLEELLGVHIDTVSIRMPYEASTMYSWPVDTVLQRMMSKSDNMLAEHLLLCAGMEVADTLDFKQVVVWAKDTLLQGIPQQLYWMDGSGLSRYNRFTPESILFVLKKIYKEYPEARWTSLFPTIRKRTLLRASLPVIYYKSGSMSGIYNNSGFIKTKSGKTLAYSFMNNNFGSKVSAAKNATVSILNYIANNY